MNEEKWCDIRGYEEIYQISNQGKVKSKARNISTKINTIQSVKERLLKPALDKKTGYLCVNLSKKGKGKLYKIHRLVALCFVNNNQNNIYVNHIDGIKTNNYYSNLEWCTKSEDAFHSYKLGLQNKKGENNGRHKLTLGDVLIIKKLLNEKINQKQIAELYNVHLSTIGRISTKKTWKHI